MKQPVVAIVQRVLPHYRIPFFTGLSRLLAESGVSLRLIYGQEYPETVPRTVDCREDWCRRISNRYLRLPGLELVWQPCLADVTDADLIIVEQANRLLTNVPILRSRGKRGRKVAYFGHGRTRRTEGRYLREIFRRFLLRRVDWWFAYTGLTAENVAAAGFPRDRITTVNNTVDTESFSRDLAAVPAAEIAALAARLGISGDNVVLFCGGMDSGKRLDFALEACAALRRRLSDFEAIFIGDGPALPLVEEAARRCDWIHPAGALFGAARAPFFRLGRALLVPGPVGLVIADGFAAGTPLITTDIDGHGPEIAYLENGTNGIITTNTVHDYVDAVARFLESKPLRIRLAEGCRKSAQRYTMANMVGNFALGVEECLSR